MENKGWIKMHRRLLDWEWYDDIPVFRLFTHLLISANYEPSKYHGYDIPAGSAVTGLFALSKQTGLSESQIRGAMQKLKNTGEITIKTTNKFSIISIVKWGEYQTEQQTVDNLPTNEQQHLKNLRNKKEEYITTNIRKGRQPKAAVTLPDFISQKDWDDFSEMRKKIGKPMTDRAAQGIFRKLEKLKNDGQDPAKVLEQSIINCWRDVFAVKGDWGSNNLPKKKLTAKEQAMKNVFG